MNHISIKNIDDNVKEISNDSFFIVIWFENKTGIENIIGNIYKPRLLSIFQILKNEGINLNNFSFVGDLQIDNIDKIPIVMVNKKITADPLDYINIGNISNSEYIIWKPLSMKGYSGIGNIVSLEKPSLKAISTIDNNFLINYNGDINKKFNIFTKNEPDYMIDIYGNPLLWGNIINGEKVSLFKAQDPWFNDKEQIKLDIVKEQFDVNSDNNSFSKFNLAYFLLLVIVVIMLLKQWS